MAKKNSMILTQDEIYKIQKHDLVMQNKHLEKQINLLQRQNLQLTYELQMAKLTTSGELIARSIDDKIESHKQYMKSIADLKGIEGKWSFNPDSGEITKEGYNE